jgi:hypothetical protein
MFRNALIVVLMLLFTSFVFADDVITVTGKYADAFADVIHMYTDDKYMEIDKVPKNVIEKIQKLDMGKIITLKIKKQGGKYIFVSLVE